MHCRKDVLKADKHKILTILSLLVCLCHFTRDLKFGVEQDVDMVFASFIRKAADVKAVREVLGEKGKHIAIVSKVGMWF